MDSAGDLFIADFNNFRVREVTISNGNINTVAGTGADGTRTMASGYQQQRSAKYTREWQSPPMARL